MTRHHTSTLVSSATTMRLAAHGHEWDSARGHEWDSARGHEWDSARGHEWD